MRTSLLLSKIFALSVDRRDVDFFGNTHTKTYDILQVNAASQGINIVKTGEKTKFISSSHKKMSVFYSLTSRWLTIVKVKILPYTVALKIHPVTKRLLRD